MEDKKGFTLIELLVVISIIGLLSSFVLASVNSARAKARDAARGATVAQIQLALDGYYTIWGRYPAMTEDECGGTEGWTTTNNNFMQALVTGGYLWTHPSDPVKTNCKMQYTTTADGACYVIFVQWETKPQSGCIGNHPNWSCVGVNPCGAGW